MQNINETLDQAIRDKDITAVRRALGTWILQDPGFAKGVFDEKLRYCLSRGISEAELFVPFAGEPLNEDPAAWTDRYFASAKTEFDSNFSRKRLDHLKKVGAKLFPSASASPASSNQEEVKKKYAAPQPAERRSSIPAPARQPAGKKSGSVWWIAAAGIGLAAILFLLLKRK